MTAEDYIANLESAIAKHAPDLDGVRADRAATEMARTLRSQQDSAYERSLAVDRERARQRREAAAAAAEAEKRALEEAEAAARLVEQRQQWREWRASTTAPEPDAGVKDAVRLALNMPASSSAGAGRVVRRFAPQTTLEELYAFVECYDLLQEGVREKGAERPEDYDHKYGFQISSLMPRETLEPSKTVTLGAKLGRGGNLVVESLSADEEDDDDDNDE
jgi:FAS-associated factor 2